VPHGILHVFIIIFYENVFKNPELFLTQVNLFPEQFTLAVGVLRDSHYLFLTPYREFE
jgi:hypothetical protein